MFICAVSFGFGITLLFFRILDKFAPLEYSLLPLKIIKTAYWQHIRVGKSETTLVSYNYSDEFLINKKPIKKSAEV